MVWYAKLEGIDNGSDGSGTLKAMNLKTIKKGITYLVRRRIVEKRNGTWEGKDEAA